MDEGVRLKNPDAQSGPESADDTPRPIITQEGEEAYYAKWITMNTWSCKVLHTIMYIVLLLLVNAGMCGTMYTVATPGHGAWVAYMVGFILGCIKAPVVSAGLMVSVARIESLGWCYPWDILLCDIWALLGVIIPIVQVFRAYAVEDGGWIFNVSIALDNTVQTSMIWAIPCYTYLWTYGMEGTGLPMYKWQKRLPFYGLMAQNTFWRFHNRQQELAAGGVQCWCLRCWSYGGWCRPWGPWGYTTRARYEAIYNVPGGPLGGEVYAPLRATDIEAPKPLVMST